jgi:hypothetical protein
LLVVKRCLGAAVCGPSAACPSRGTHKAGATAIVRGVRAQAACQALGGRIHAPLAFLTHSAGGHATPCRDKLPPGGILSGAQNLHQSTSFIHLDTSGIQMALLRPKLTSIESAALLTQRFKNVSLDLSSDACLTPPLRPPFVICFESSQHATFGI